MEFVGTFAIFGASGCVGAYCECLAYFRMFGGVLNALKRF